MKLHTSSTALVVGVFVAFMHLIWMVMVYLGLGQMYLDWIFGLHLITNPFMVMPFNFGAALTLIAFTFVVGYVFGWIFAMIWNKLRKGK